MERPGRGQPQALRDDVPRGVEQLVVAPRARLPAPRRSAARARAGARRTRRASPPGPPPPARAPGTAARARAPAAAAARRGSRRASRRPGAMNTLPAPSTASPVKAPSPATKTRWSGAWPGTCSAVSGPNASPSPSATVAPGQRIAPTGGPPSASRSAAAPSAWSGWSCVSAIPPAPPRAATAAATAATCSASSGPGSTTQAGSRPDDPRVRAVERVGRRVARADERDVHGASALSGDDPVDGPVERGGVHAAERVLAERGEVRDPQRRRLDAARLAAGELRLEDPALAEVAEHVAAAQRQRSGRGPTRRP